jgi:hypothetical protein
MMIDGKAGYHQINPNKDIPFKREARLMTTREM